MDVDTQGGLNRSYEYFTGRFTDITGSLVTLNYMYRTYVCWWNFVRKWKFVRYEFPPAICTYRQFVRYKLPPAICMYPNLN